MSAEAARATTMRNNCPTVGILVASLYDDRTVSWVPEIKTKHVLKSWIPPLPPVSRENNNQLCVMFVTTRTVIISSDEDCLG